ncbi:D-arabinono-1,4-lactone oxidase [Oceanitalea stevensii]|uniref:FAD-binding protein n=1 Tax=Oceanitalea stevensii TaxID=2763072 RepID=A0ABR8Z1E3_9MICO|nr:D-arabinono-1,4-lactone oxidase [Oceanitalea stevensii]MBD8062070.1 FAD-binding protein [Oceanitalea stevensii]
MTWRNWSGTVAVTPAEVLVPRDTAEVAAIVRRAAATGRRVTAVGAGHSFTPVAEARDVQLRLDRLTGIVAVEPEGRVRVRAGTRLRELSALLATHGLALENLGDIDVQTLAGALSTGTHGTGARFGGLATQVVGLELVRGDGEVVRLGDGAGPPVEAAVVGLGALGIVTEVTLRCVPAFTLHAVEDVAPLDAVLEGLDERVAGHDHYEFYWFPHTERCLTKANTRHEGARPQRPLPAWRRVLEDEVLTNAAYAVVNEAGRLRPAWVPGLNRLATRVLSRREYDDVSPRVFATSRRVRFVESEYAVPRAALPAVLAGLRAWVDGRPGAAVQFPVEVRFAAADDVWLSTAYGRETAYVAVHQFHRSPAREYFRAFEAIALAHEGRPHWGKLHGLGAADLAGRYPRMGEVRALREELDPGRVFANGYRTRVLGR